MTRLLQEKTSAARKVGRRWHSMRLERWEGRDLTLKDFSLDSGNNEKLLNCSKEGDYIRAFKRSLWFAV